MLTGLFGRKNNKKFIQMPKIPKNTPPAPTAEPAPSAPQRSGASVAGIPMATFAQQSGLSLNDVWQKIQRGELPARFLNNQVSVFPDLIPGHAPSAAPHETAVTGARRSDPHDHLASMRDSEPDANPNTTSEQLTDEPFIETFYGLQGKGELPPVTITYESQELHSLVKSEVTHDSFHDMALLLDHLSLAKEENKEIIRLTKDSIGTITSMSESIVALKDELLKAKELQIDNLQRELDAKEGRIAKLKQELEDMQMLAETLMKNQKSE